MKKIFFLAFLLLFISCSKSNTFVLQSFDSTVIQNSSTSKRPNTEIVTTVNGESFTLNLQNDFFYDLDEDEYVHLIQDYEQEILIDDQYINIIVFFDIMTNRDNNTIVDGLPDGQGGILETANTMTININGDETIVSVVNATVDYPNVSFDDGKYSFSISL